VVDLGSYDALLLRLTVDEASYGDTDLFKLPTSERWTSGLSVVPIVGLTLIVVGSFSSVVA